MDVEKNGNGRQHETTVAVTRASAMLLLFSFFLLVEGVIRVVSVSTTPDSMWTGSDTMFPPIVLLVAAVVEVFFAMFGVMVGAASLLLDLRSVVATGACAIFILCGWFTFIVYTIAAPAFGVNNTPAMGGPLSVSEMKVATTFGEILASIVYCFVMQGGQFYFSLSLLAAVREGPGILAYNTKAKQQVRMLVYSGMVCLGGTSILILGCLLRSKLGPGPFAKPSVFPPNVVIYPEMTIVSGILELVYGLTCVANAVGQAPSMPVVASVGVLTWSWLMGGHVMGQIGLLGGMVSGPAAQIVCLSTSLILMPIYFGSEVARADTGHEQY